MAAFVAADDHHKRALGKEVVRQVARLGVTVLLGSRNAARGEEAAGEQACDARGKAANVNSNRLMNGIRMMSPPIQRSSRTKWISGKKRRSRPKIGRNRAANFRSDLRACVEL
jgi:NAD(P)-dependent dehydrogenase (short-subunit alcohol dehydrogenase family)